MALETVTYIGDLVETNPTSSDPKQQGDDHFRNVKKAIKNSFPGFAGAVLVSGTDGGVVNAYTLTPATALSAYTNKLLIEFTPNATNTATAPSLNISGLGPKTIKSVDNGALLVGDLVAGTPVLAVYDGSSVRLLGPTKTYIDQLAFNAALPNQPGGTTPHYLDSTSSIASWKAVIPIQILRSARTSNTAIAAADRASLIDITSGTFTQTFAAAATLGNGWYCYLGNSGTGDITLDPNGAETIDGMSSFVMYPGELRLVVCDGAALTTRVLKGFSKTFTSTGPFVKPPGYEYVEGEMWSGGSSGAVTATATSAAPGGGGGGCFPFKLPLSLFAASETITVGAGGAPVSSTGDAAGNIGGASSIGSILVMSTPGDYSRGSALTTGNSLTPAGFEVAFESNGNVGRSVYGGSTATTQAGTNGSSIYGGGAGGGWAAGGGLAAPGTSKIGGNGGAAGNGANGTAGSIPGGGGGACKHNGAGTTYSSGPGARGEVRIRGIQ